MKNAKVIISNIGNRNITYDGKLYEDLYPSRESKNHTSFRQFTKELLIENGDGNFFINPEYKSHLDLNIIQTLIDKYQLATEVIVLCSSDQIPPHDQDTLYEAWIMKDLIEDKYQIHVEIREIKCSVVDVNSLMNRYRQIMNWVNRRFSDYYIHICDAGGTPQQKSSLKLITEFIIDPSRSKVEYVFPGNKIKEIPPIEYRNIISSMQADVLVKQCEYHAALALFNTNASEISIDPGSVLFKKLMALGVYISKNNFNKAAHIAQSFKENYKEKNPFIFRYQDGVPAGNFDPFEASIERVQFFRLCENFARAQYFYNIENFSGSIMNYSVFYEMYINGTLSKLFDLDLSESYNYEEKMREISDRGIAKFPDLAKNYPSSRRSSIPFKIDLLQRFREHKTHCEFIDLLKSYISGFPNESTYTSSKFRSINSLRNRIAHDGLEISKSRLQQEAPYYYKLLNSTAIMFGLPKNNLYQELYHAVKRSLTA